MKDMIFCKAASYKAIKKNVTKISANVHYDHHSFDDEDMKRNCSFCEISVLHMNVSNFNLYKTISAKIQITAYLTVNYLPCHFYHSFIKQLVFVTV